MALDLLFNFFPSLTNHLKALPIGNAIVHLLIDDQQQCTEVTLTIPWGNRYFIFRQPVLFLMAITGTVIGLRGWLSLPSKYWSIAFGSFAAMNVSAVFLHCIWPQNGDSNYPGLYPITWTIDTYMTGVSSVSLLVAGLESLWGTCFRNLHWLFGILQSVGILCIVCFFHAESQDFTVAPTYPLELWYLVPPLLAGPLLVQNMFGNLFRNPLTFQWTCGHALYVSGVLSMVLGIGFEWFWCRTFGTVLADFFTTINLVFGGCNLCFLGIHQWIQLSEHKKHTD